MALVTCKECSQPLSTKADACPKCGAKIKKTSPLAMGCLIAILAFVAIGVVGSSREKASKPASGGSSSVASSSSQRASASAPAAPVRALSVSIGTLLSEYKDNEVRADASYKDKVIEVSGKVGEIKKDIMGSLYVTIGTGKQFEIPEVQCFFEDEHAGKLASLSNGQTIKVQGRVDGLMMNVLVKDCVVLGQ